MAVSSLGNPVYDTPEQLLIGYEFSVSKIFRHFGIFLSYAIQFMLMYATGYLFYIINSKLLVPKLMQQKGLLYYIFGSLAVVGVLYPLMAKFLLLLPINDRLGGIFPENPFALENAAAALAIFAISLPIILSIQWSRQNARITGLEKEKTIAELEGLRQQLNPHFFFNTLNNLYALSLQKSPQTAESILRLSDLMRYVIYKGKETMVSVEAEVSYLEDYLELQQMRLKNSLALQFDKEIQQPNLQLPPLLLIVLLENAFKHGIEPATSNTYLKLFLKTSAATVHFKVENEITESVSGEAGIGLQNLRKRLELLYPGAYQLTTRKENNSFIAEMYIQQ